MLKYRLRRIPRKKLIFWSTFILIFMISIGSIVRFYAIADMGQESILDNITDDTVYVNDLQADWDYYQSLNFTEITDKKTLPGKNVDLNSLKYTKDTLVAVQINYNGLDINGKSNSKKSDWFGWVSNRSTEHQSNFVYLKYYPIKDGNVIIELIDNPYTARPVIGNEQFKGFNGWVCDDEATNGVDCSKMTFTYDYDYYVRYVTVPESAITTENDGDKTMVLNLRATWVDATSGWTYNDTEMGRFKKGMVKLDTVNVYDKKWKFTGNYIFRPGQKYYEKKSVELGETFYGISKNFVDYTTEGRACETGSGDTDVRIEQQIVDGETNDVEVEYCNYYVLTADTTGNTSKQYWYWNGDILSEVNFTSGAGLIKETNGTENANAKAVLATYQVRARTGVDTWSTPTYAQYENGESLAGLYYQMEYPGSNPHLYYNGNGVSCTRTTCSKGATVYKLIQTNDTTKYNGYSISTMNIVTKNYASVDENGTYAQTKTVYNDVSKYYYLATRDTNIMHFGSGYGISSTVNSFNSNYSSIKYTLSGAPGRGDSINAGLEIEDVGLRVYNDMVIENLWNGTNSNDVRIDNANRNYMGSGWYNFHIYAECRNLKIGRYAGIEAGSKNYANSSTFFARGVYGGMVKSTPDDRYARTIVESGYYYHSQTLGNKSVSNSTGLQMVFGSDYDRVSQVNGDNSKLRFYRTVCAAYSGGEHDDENNTTIPVSFITTKSGTFGSGVINNFDEDDDYAFGLYSASYMNASGDALRVLKIEGGNIACVNGGPGTNDQQEIMSATYMTGGSAINIVGGAGTDMGYGHRLVSISGGTVKNAVVGGSNSNVGGGKGILKGSTLVYVGGSDTIIGDTTYSALFGVAERGSVFGAGLGRNDSNNEYAGTVRNSRVIINGGTINGSVYGGGNRGGVGNYYDATANTEVYIYDGNIKGSVYGAGNNSYAANGFSTNDYTNSSKIYMLMTGGTVNGSLYGGSNLKGRTYGFIDIDLLGGNINNSVYGASNASSNAVNSSIDIELNGSIVHKGIYGGSNTSGNVSKVVNITLKKGIVGVNCSDSDLTCGSVYGGGYGANTKINNNVNVSTSTNVDSDLVVRNIYGGSCLGNVNNQTSNSYTTNVTINGGTVTDAVYGGGMGNASTKPISNGNITVEIKNGKVNNAYGGSNVNGALPASGKTMKITVSGGTVNNVYGGSKGSAATVGTSNVIVTGGTIKTAVYGGGNQANTTTSNVTISGGTFAQIDAAGYLAVGTTAAEVFGGGYSAKVTTTNVDILEGANVYNVYGGSNLSGLVTTSNVDNNAGNILCNSYGGGKIAPVTTTNNNLNGSVFTYKLRENETAYSATCGNAFGGGANADVGTEANITLNAGSLINVYGGSNEGGAVKLSDVIIKSGTTQNVFGGNNLGGSIADTKVTVDGTSNLSVNNVFGGSNGIGTLVTNTTTTNINNGTITGDVFGGGNQAKVVNATYVNMRGGTVHSLYGGGNRSFVGDATINNNGALVQGITTGATYVNVIAGTINGNVYGSSNASFVYGTTSVKIGDYALTSLGISDSTKRNITIKGSVFAGSETNADKSTTYDDNYEGVTGPSGSGTGLVEIGGSKYIVNDESVLKINGSIYGSGNNSKVVNGSTVYITSLGTKNNPLVITSLQRATTVYVTDSHMELNGSVDRADPDSYRYSLIRLDNLYLLGSSATKGTYMYLRQGASYLKALNSGVMKSGTFTPQKVTESNGKLSVSVSDNRIYMLTNKVLSVSDSSAPIYDTTSTKAGPITGMTFLGMYRHESGKDFVRGIYDYSYSNGSVYSAKDTGTIVDTAYTFVYGLNLEEYTMKQQVVQHGFYTNVIEGEEDEVLGSGSESDGGSDDGKTLKYQYVGVTPANETTLYYKWVIGVEPVEIVVDLVADKYSESGAVNALISLDELKETILNADGSETRQEWRDAIMTIESVDTTAFGATAADATKAFDGILVDKSEIPTINTDDKNNDGVVDANNYFALSMGTTSTGWLNDYKTNFYDYDYELTDENFCSTATGNCTGNQVYLYDSTTKPRNLSFWLYHSKNLDFSYVDKSQDLTNMLIKMNTVYIDVEFRNPHGDPTSTDSIQPVRITVNIALSDGELDKYGGVIAPGKQYEMFQGRPTVISSNGSFSIYQQLSLDLTKTIAGSATGEKWGVEKLYHPEKTVTIKDAYNQTRDVEWSESYRYLASSYLLPVGTVITMLDLKNNEQYYYEVTDQNYSEKETEYAGKNEYKYFLEDFVRMGSTTKSNKFDDDMKEEQSTKYYYHDENSKLAVEEFIFNVDFAGADVEIKNANGDTHYFYLQLARLEDGAEKVVMSTKGSPMTEMVYTLKPQVSSEISTVGGYLQEDGSISEDTIIYVGESAGLELETSLIQLDENGNLLVGVSDTKFDEYKLGAKITIKRAQLDEDGNIKYDSNNNIIYEVVTSDLFGTVMEINGRNYYPQTDGSTRLELAGRITDVVSDINLDFSNSGLTYGKYVLVVETFVSYDGLYYGDFEPTYSEFPFELLNNQYGLDVKTETPKQITHDVNTGMDSTGNRQIHYLVDVVNGLADPNLKVSIERRDYGTTYGTGYHSIPVDNIIEEIKFGDSEDNLVTTNGTCFSMSTDNSCYIYSIGDISSGSVLKTYDVYLTLKNGPEASDLGTNKPNAKWKSGTYKVIFTLYDGDVEVGSVYEYLIIRSLSVDEIVIEGSGN